MVKWTREERAIIEDIFRPSRANRDVYEMSEEERQEILKRIEAGESVFFSKEDLQAARKAELEKNGFVGTRIDWGK